MKTQIVDVGYNRGVKPDTIRLVLRYAAAAAAVMIITLIYRRIVHVNPTTVALTFLLAVLLISASWGLRCAVFKSAAPRNNRSMTARTVGSFSASWV